MTILGHILAGKCNQITLKTSRKKQERLWNGYEIDGYMPCMVLIAQVVGNKITKVTTNTHAHTINIRVLRNFFWDSPILDGTAGNGAIFARPDHPSRILPMYITPNGFEWSCPQNGAFYHENHRIAHYFRYILVNMKRVRLLRQNGNIFIRSIRSILHTFEHGRGCILTKKSTNFHWAIRLNLSRNSPLF